MPNAAQFDDSLARLAVAGFFIPTVLFALLGGCYVVRRGTTDPRTINDRPSNWPRREVAWFLLLTAGPIVYFTGLHLVFVSSLRYRLPAEYPLLILTAVGLQVGWHWWRGRRSSAQVAA